MAQWSLQTHHFTRNVEARDPYNPEAVGVENLANASPLVVQIGGSQMGQCSNATMCQNGPTRSTDQCGQWTNAASRAMVQHPKKAPLRVFTVHNVSE